MTSNKKAIEERIQAIEEEMSTTDFWSNKEKAQQAVKELNELKAKAAGVNKYDNGNAVITIFSGAGGDDAEDFSRILYDMYSKFIEKRGWGARLLHKNENNHN